jgi:hypothetical protein
MQLTKAQQQEEELARAAKNYRALEDQLAQEKTRLEDIGRRLDLSVSAAEDTTIGRQQLIYLLQQLKAYVGDATSLVEVARINALVQQINDEKPELRRRALDRLMMDHTADPVAIGLMLEKLTEPKLGSLSVQGRANALVFLNGTNPATWTEHQRRLGSEAIRRIRSRANRDGVVLGSETERELTALERKLTA